MHARCVVEDGEEVVLVIGAVRATLNRKRNTENKTCAEAQEAWTFLGYKRRRTSTMWL